MTFSRSRHSTLARRTLGAPIALALGAAPAASAQWTVLDLHPPGATMSVARAMRSGQEVGYAAFGGADRACLWTGSPASMVNLNPPGSIFSFAFGADNGHQVGNATVDG